LNCQATTGTFAIDLNSGTTGNTLNNVILGTAMNANSCDITNGSTFQSFVFTGTTFTGDTFTTNTGSGYVQTDRLQGPAGNNTSQIVSKSTLQYEGGLGTPTDITAGAILMYPNGQFIGDVASASPQLDINYKPYSTGSVTGSFGVYTKIVSIPFQLFCSDRSQYHIRGNIPYTIHFDGNVQSPPDVVAIYTELVVGGVNTYSGLQYTSTDPYYLTAGSSLPVLSISGSSYLSSGVISDIYYTYQGSNLTDLSVGNNSVDLNIYMMPLGNPALQLVLSNFRFTPTFEFCSQNALPP
jgi:hypothetical protein